MGKFLAPVQHVYEKITTPSYRASPLTVNLEDARCSYIRVTADNGEEPVVSSPDTATGKHDAKSTLMIELVCIGAPIQTKWTITVLYKCGDGAKSKKYF